MRKLSAHGAALIAIVALAVVAAACGSSTAGSSPPPEQTDADVTITSRDMAFDQASLTIEAGSASSLRLVNEDAAPHNVAIYSDESATESLFIGELITGTSIVYELPALEPGTYFFRCDLHPEMNGALTVQG
jgi:plastocyanin